MKVGWRTGAFADEWGLRVLCSAMQRRFMSANIGSLNWRGQHTAKHDTVGKIQEKYMVKYGIMTIRGHCDITQRIAVIPCRPFGIPSGPIFKIPRFIDPWRLDPTTYPETSVGNYQYAIRNSPSERRCTSRWKPEITEGRRNSPISEKRGQHWQVADLQGWPASQGVL
jgi:hypothetical protein